MAKEEQLCEGTKERSRNVSMEVQEIVRARMR